MFLIGRITENMRDTCYGKTLTAFVCDCETMTKSSVICF